MGTDLLADQLGLGQVESITPQGDHLGLAGEVKLEFPRDLPVVAGNKDLHANRSASLKLTPVLSLADSCGASASGHSMARSGSSQRMQRSCSGA
ncbi:hypothetical protein D9M68_666430 [compost metagenome]